MHHVSGVTSTMTGSAPAAIGAYAVAANVSAGMITSSPQPMPSALQRHLHRDGAVQHQDAVLGALVRRERVFEPPP